MKTPPGAHLRINSSKRIAPAQVRALFRAAGWREDIARFSPAQIQKFLRHSHLILTAWSDARELVGFVSAVSDGVLFGWVQNLVVHPTYRGRGLGTELLRETVREMQKQGIQGVYVLGTRGKRARAFFARVGFRPLDWNIFLRISR